MEDKIYITVVELCNYYELTPSFFDELFEKELIPLDVEGDTKRIHRDGLVVLEKIIRIHHELHINVEGIDAVFNLLEKIEMMQDEMTELKRKLNVYEEILSIR